MSCEEYIFNILKEPKFEFYKKSGKLKIKIYDNNKTVAFLHPISLGFEEDDGNIRLLSKWRADNWQAYPTVFKVTEEGTKKWVKSQLIDRQDRILFLIVLTDGTQMGHLGLSNFDFLKNEAEIDNVIRGISNCLPGIMTLAMNTLDNWAFTKLKLDRLFLRVFLDNERAIRLYERCGFKRVKEIPLHKNVDGDIIKYEEIDENDKLSIDRTFLMMELVKNK